MRLTIIGRGRAALTLGPLWAEAFEVDYIGRETLPEEIPETDILVFAIPDQSLAEVARLVAQRPYGGEIWLHLSGVTPASVLRPSPARSVACLHPLCALHPGQSPRGAMGGIEGEAGASEVARELAALAGLWPYEIPEDRALYHAAAVTVAGHLTALFSEGCRMMEAAGFDEKAAQRALWPLAQSAIQNLKEHPPEEAITGPAARGDLVTLRRHLEAMGAQGLARSLALYRGLAEVAIELKAPSEASREKMRAILE